MDDFSTPNTTNFFGIPASPANFIKPYKRPLSSMAPTIVLDAAGDVVLVTGASGGSRIITSTALVYKYFCIHIIVNFTIAQPKNYFKI